MRRCLPVLVHARWGVPAANSGRFDTKFRGVKISKLVTRTTPPLRQVRDPRPATPLSLIIADFTTGGVDVGLRGAAVGSNIQVCDPDGRPEVFG